MEVKKASTKMELSKIPGQKRNDGNRNRNKSVEITPLQNVTPNCKKGSVVSSITPKSAEIPKPTLKRQLMPQSEVDPTQPNYMRFTLAFSARIQPNIRRTKEFRNRNENNTKEKDSENPLMEVPKAKQKNVNLNREEGILRKEPPASITGRTIKLPTAKTDLNQKGKATNPRVSIDAAKRNLQAKTKSTIGVSSTTTRGKNLTIGPKESILEKKQTAVRNSKISPLRDAVLKPIRHTEKTLTQSVSKRKEQIPFVNKSKDEFTSKNEVRNKSSNSLSEFRKEEQCTSKINSTFSDEETGTYIIHRNKNLNRNVLIKEKVPATPGGLLKTKTLNAKKDVLRNVARKNSGIEKQIPSLPYSADSLNVTKDNKSNRTHLPKSNKNQNDSASDSVINDSLSIFDPQTPTESDTGFRNQSASSWSKSENALKDTDSIPSTSRKRFLELPDKFPLKAISQIESLKQFSEGKADSTEAHGEKVVSVDAGSEVQTVQNLAVFNWLDLPVSEHPETLPISLDKQEHDELKQKGDMSTDSCALPEENFRTLQNMELTAHESEIKLVSEKPLSTITEEGDAHNKSSISDLGSQSLADRHETESGRVLGTEPREGKLSTEDKPKISGSETPFTVGTSDGTKPAVVEGGLGSATIPENDSPEVDEHPSVFTPRKDSPQSCKQSPPLKSSSLSNKERASRNPFVHCDYKKPSSKEKQGPEGMEKVASNPFVAPAECRERQNRRKTDQTQIEQSKSPKKVVFNKGQYSQPTSCQMSSSLSATTAKTTTRKVKSSITTTTKNMVKTSKAIPTKTKTVKRFIRSISVSGKPNKKGMFTVAKLNGIQSTTDRSTFQRSQGNASTVAKKKKKKKNKRAAKKKRKMRLPYLEKPKQNEKVDLFKLQFGLFGQFGDRRNSGQTISMTNTVRWLKQAGIVDHRKVTPNDVEIYFIFTTKRRRSLNMLEFIQFLKTLCTEKALNIASVVENLLTCGEPAVSVTDITIEGVVASESTSQCTPNPFANQVSSKLPSLKNYPYKSSPAAIALKRAMKTGASATSRSRNIDGNSEQNFEIPFPIPTAYFAASSEFLAVNSSSEIVNSKVDLSVSTELEVKSDMAHIPGTKSPSQQQRLQSPSNKFSESQVHPSSTDEDNKTKEKPKFRRKKKMQGHRDRTSIQALNVNNDDSEDTDSDEHFSSLKGKLNKGNLETDAPSYTEKGRAIVDILSPGRTTEARKIIPMSSTREEQAIRLIRSKYKSLPQSKHVTFATRDAISSTTDSLQQSHSMNTLPRQNASKPKYGEDKIVGILGVIPDAETPPEAFPKLQAVGVVRRRKKKRAKKSQQVKTLVEGISPSSPSES